MDRYRDFTVLITKINRSVKKIKAIETGEFGLKGPHVSCLYYLNKMEKLTAKELCDVCKEDKASISRSIEYLEEKGYLQCSSQLKKRYNSPLSLTPQGREISQKIVDKVDSILLLASGTMDNTKRNIMYEGLTTICENLENFCKKYEGEEN